MERVALLLGPVPDRAAASVMLIPLGEAALRRCLVLAEALRAAAMPAEVAYGARRLRVELERANRLRVPYVLIAGDDELASGRATLRVMATGTQESLAFDDVVSALIQRRSAVSS
jgi:histidyl-tRNA synthetase